MKYFKISIKKFYKNDMIAPQANGRDIEDAEYYFEKMKGGEFLNEAPIFDYFFLESFDKREYWEWKLFDVHNFIGEGSQIGGWLISNKLVDIIENHKLTNTHHLYRSKLFYKREKFDYSIFQFSGNEIVESVRNNISFTNTLFYDPNQNKNIRVENKEQFVAAKKRILKDSGYDNCIKIKKLVLNEEFDFFPMQGFLEDNIISERLKNNMENENIEGFEYSELNYDVKIQPNIT